MVTYAIGAGKYDMDLDRLLCRRLSQCGCLFALATDGTDVTVTVQEGEQVLRLAEALTMLLCRDLSYYELARMTDALPLPIAEKQTILKAALKHARRDERPALARDGLIRYLAEARRLNLEGYLQFRLRPMLELWQDAVEQAAAETVFRREYAHLMGSLQTLSEQQPSGEISICLHPDLSCTLTDAMGGCIEYADCSEESIVSLIVGMAPTFLTVYDLSGGRCRTLIDLLKGVFPGRMRLYR